MALELITASTFKRFVMHKLDSQAAIGGQYAASVVPMHWQPMKVDEFAALEMRLGAKLTKSGGVWWRRLRPFFYRPLLCYVPLDGPCITRPIAWAAAFQYGVSNPAISNSMINYLVLDRLRGYDMMQLGRRKRQLLHQAAKTFTVRPIQNREELKRAGYQAYMSFYERTGYAYLKQRRRKVGFDYWVDTIFEYGKPLVLGGYDGDQLKGVSVSYLVEDTVVYATLFVETAAMKKNLGELMFHELRLRASQERGVRQIFLRPYRGGNSQDCYYLHRGATLVRQPARLHIYPLILPLIKWVSPQYYAALVGNR